MSYNLNFYTVAFGPYNIFVLPYIVSALYHNETASAEILVDNTRFLTKKAKEYLNYYFKDRWTIRQLDKRFSSWKNIKFKKSIRWLTIPRNRMAYTYIGDIDILILDKDIYKDHVEHANNIGLPYSNIVRPNGINMTGLHFVITDPYYAKMNQQYLDKVVRNITKGKFRPKALDERLLCTMVKQKIGINNIKKYRPGHGLHLSIRRPIVKWVAGGGRSLREYNEFKNTTLWKGGLSLFHNNYLGILNRITEATAYCNKRIQLGKAIKRTTNKKVQKKIIRKLGNLHRVKHNIAVDNILDMSIILTYKNRYDNLLYNLQSINNSIECIPNVTLVDFGNNPKLVLPDFPWVKIIRVDEKTDLFHKSRAMNIAIKRINTPYICCTDVDQIHQKNFFLSVFRALKSCLTPFVICKTWDLKKFPEWLNYTNVNERYGEVLVEAKKTRLHGAGCLQAARTDWFRAVRGYDEGFIGRGCQDSDLLRRAKMSGLKVVNITNKTSMIHLHHKIDRTLYCSGITRRKNRVYYNKVIKERIIIANKNGNWGKIRSDEPNDSIIKKEVKKGFFKQKVNKKNSLEGKKDKKLPIKVKKRRLKKIKRVKKVSKEKRILVNEKEKRIQRNLIKEKAERASVKA